jgi:anaerobic selenocysteine-containing dehydrogenase
VVAPDRDVRPFKDVVIELGYRLGLPAFTTEDGWKQWPGGYSDYLVNHQRGPGIGPLAGWRGEDGESSGVGAPNPNQLERYIENGCFWKHELKPEQRYFKHSNKDYLEWSASMGFIPNAEPIVLRLYSEPLQKFRSAAEGHGEHQPPTEAARARILKNFDPLPRWRPPLNGLEDPDGAFPLHAITQRPMAMYHSWGSQNAWLRQIHTENRLFVARQTVEALGLEDDCWVYVTSPNGRIKARIKAMEGVNPRTVWTWNAIGKRKGAWGLSDDAPESKRAFLLNHLISELLPEDEGGQWPNADPVTGQAAWYDLRVKIEAAPAELEETEPMMPALPQNPAGAPRPDVLRYGAAFRHGWGHRR